MGASFVNRSIYDRDGMYMGTVNSRVGRDVGGGGGGGGGAGQYKGKGGGGLAGKTTETDLESLTTSASSPARGRAVGDF